jgi:trehalose 6-phosphate phosphatase
MPYLFDNLEAIGGMLALSPFGIITDVDGTISEIAPSPAEAGVHPECKAQLARLVERLPLVAAISGRPVLEAKKMVGIDGMVYIGNHGLERWSGGMTDYVEGVEGYRSKLAAARRELADLSSIGGIHIEDKGVALAIHYRNCPDRERARQLILKQVERARSAEGFKIVEGKMVVELRPSVEVNKGSAVSALIGDYRLAGGIYMGDDASDLDAFRVMRGDGFAAVGVLGDETPDEVEREADYTLDGIGDVARFLKWLAESAGNVST